MKIHSTPTTLGALAICVLANTAHSQDYPVKPITLIVPFAAGGPSDAYMRPFAIAMGRLLKQPVIIENVGGNAANIGTARAARAAPDGYTLLQHNLTFSTAPALFKNPGFNPLNDFDFIGTLTFDPSLLMARSDFPGDSFTEFLAYVKTNQAKVSIGTSGPSHLAALLFMEATGTKLNVVPYKGGAPALNDLVGKHVDLVSNSASIVGPLIRAGKVRAIGVTSRTRVAHLPEIPTLDEQGLKGFEMVVWTSVFAPRGLPKPVLDRLATAMRGTLSDPDILAYSAKTGGQMATPEQASPAGLAALVKSEVEKWGSILKRAGIQPE